MDKGVNLSVNEKRVSLSIDPDTPLLYVLMDDLALKGPRFGCGLAQCGACSVLIDGVERRSCITKVSACVGKEITTLEGLPKWYAKQRNLKKVPEMHPLQQEIINVQSAQCGYCYNGQIIKGAELLSKNQNPSDAEVRAAMNGHICRCGTYPRLLVAIQQAGKAMS